MLLEIIMVVSDWMQYRLIDGAQHGLGISTDAANANDLRQSLLVLLHLVVFIISSITFIMWFRRAYYNLHIKLENKLHQPEGWAAGGWFVPIVCWYRPYRIMKEMYEETHSFFEKRVEFYTERKSLGYVKWWWALWVALSILGNILFQLSKHADTLDQIMENTLLGMGINILDIPLAILTVKVIKDYSSMEKILAELKDEDKNAVLAEQSVLPPIAESLT
jgi:hypothetical protein